MYDDKTMALIAKRVCEEFQLKTNLFPNGSRAEGYSFVATGMVYSKVIDSLIQAINETYPDVEGLACWRVQSGRSQLPCQGVRKHEEGDCIEVRLLWR